MLDNFIEKLIRDKSLVEVHVDDNQIDGESGAPLFVSVNGFIIDYSELGLLLDTLTNADKRIRLWIPTRRVARIILPSEP